MIAGIILLLVWITWIVVLVMLVYSHFSSKKRDSMLKFTAEDADEYIRRINEVKSYSIPYWLTLKKRDPMKKAIAKVQREIKAKEQCYKNLMNTANYNFTKATKISKDVVQLGNCLATLKTLQGKK